MQTILFRRNAVDLSRLIKLKYLLRSVNTFQNKHYEINKNKIYSLLKLNVPDKASFEKQILVSMQSQFANAKHSVLSLFSKSTATNQQNNTNSGQNSSNQNQNGQQPLDPKQRLMALLITMVMSYLTLKLLLDEYGKMLKMQKGDAKAQGQGQVKSGTADADGNIHITIQNQGNALGTYASFLD